MSTGMDPKNTSDVRKTAIINNKLLCLKVDVAALQEKRLTGQSSVREKDYTFFWYGRSVDERRNHGVGFAVKNTLLQSLELESDSDKCIATLCLHTRKGTATFISVYKL